MKDDEPVIFTPDVWWLSDEPCWYFLEGTPDVPTLNRNDIKFEWQECPENNNEA